MKVNRQAQIIKLINSGEIKTQAELTELLRLKGYEVTQPTVSRDMRELNLTKFSAGEKPCYTVLPTVNTELNDKFLSIFIHGVILVDFAQNLIVIKTFPGMAMGVAACLDALNSTGILGAGLLGTVAGDDCIIGVVKSEEMAISLVNQIKNMLGELKNEQSCIK
jgi:transcriptional regulator of arginine metabolism